MHAIQGLQFAITVQLLLFAGVHSGPLPNSEDTLAIANPLGDNATTLEGMEAEDVAEDGEPSEAYLQEVREQVEAQRTAGVEAQVERDTRSTCTPSTISHGNKVAFQSYDQRFWLSCFVNPCVSRAPCPGYMMEPIDFTNRCLGEVFQIYRASGPGTVKVGDVVAFYYPYQSGKWLGCSSAHCGKFICPGTPNTTYGFQTIDRWFLCWGEVFQIYAMGKSVGSAITEQDIIMLRYINGQKWVSLSGPNVPSYPGNETNTRVILQTCPGSVRPPPVSKYESCSDEIMKIWQQ